MAFQQPQRYPSHRPSTSYTTPAPQQQPVHPSPREQSRQDDRTEWIVFSPSSEFAASTSTARTPLATQSRLSDFDSLDTCDYSGEHVADTLGEEDTEDLDSLDDGLHAFNEPADLPRVGESTGETVLPTHDGLGLFPGNSSPVQEQLWQHERYNPRRRRFSLRSSNLQQRADALSPDQDREREKNQRIEEWRVDQSNAILEEIEKESRRRQRRASNATASTRGRARSASLYSNTSIPNVDASQPAERLREPEQVHEPQSESFWQRFTRKIADLIGIDDATLSFIFGESVPSSEELEASMAIADRIDLAQATLADGGAVTFRGATWEDRLLARIAKELGVFLQSFTEHPGAFSTYLRAADTPAYAGLTPAASSRPAPRQETVDATSPSVLLQTTSPTFRPTIHAHHRRVSVAANDPSLWGIEEEPADTADDSLPSKPQDPAEAFRKEKEYWEQDLDVKMVFGFLKSRLSRSPPSDEPSYIHTANTSKSKTAHRPSSSMHTSQGDSLRRAALIRHHHPLVKKASASRPAALRLNLANASSSSASPLADSASHLARAPPSPILGRRTSADYEADRKSCASQSTKRSRTGKGSGSSRNYWDIGGGSVGSWGEV